MNIAILSRNKSLYSTRRLVEACKQRGHEGIVYDTLKCYLDVNSLKPGIKFRGERIENVDAVIPRIGASITAYGMAVVRQFEMMGSAYQLVEMPPPSLPARLLIIKQFETCGESELPAR